MAHKLDSLLQPRSIAVVGASAKKLTVGNHTLANLIAGDFPGDIYPVNPHYDNLLELKCYAAVSALPKIPDLVIFCVSDRRIEAAIDDALQFGVRAFSIMSSLVIDDDQKPLLKDRISAKLQAANAITCGANGMGFYNIDHAVWACGFDTRKHAKNGNVCLISHSGAGMCGIVDCDHRLRFNLVVSTGNELSVTMDEYLDYALELPGTKVIGLFIETARNPRSFEKALAKANRKKIPIIAIKVGRSAESAALAVSHSGAIAGDDAAYEALFDRYGVQRVRDMDELATALILHSEWPVIGPGGLVSLHDSGGERQLMMDLADEHGIPMPQISAQTVKTLESILDPELPAVNPLDGWSRGGANADLQMTSCLTALMQDTNAAVAVLMHDRAPDGKIYAEYLQYMRHASQVSGKPVALVAARQGTGDDALVVEATRDGLPVLDGVSNFLAALRTAFGWRDFLDRKKESEIRLDADVVSSWRSALRHGGTLSESISLQLLGDFDIAANTGHDCASLEQTLAAAEKIAYPVALKTAAEGIAHKSDVGGVILNIENATALTSGYDEISREIGPNVTVYPMLANGVEMILGAKQDPQFGPVIVLGFGGIHAEILGDVVFALPPFGPTTARQLLDRLRMRPLLDGVRGKKAAAIDAFCAMAAQFSAMVDALRLEIQEIDINPVIVDERSATAADALIVCQLKR